MGRKLIQRFGGDSLYPCARTRIYPQEGGCGGPFPLSSFALENWETERENTGSCIYCYPGVRKTRATPDMCLFGSSVWYHASRFIVEHCEWHAELITLTSIDDNPATKSSSFKLELWIMISWYAVIDWAL